MALQVTSPSHLRCATKDFRAAAEASLFKEPYMVPGDRMTLPPLGSAPTLVASFSFSHRAAGDEAWSDRFVQLRHQASVSSTVPSSANFRCNFCETSSMSLVVFPPLPRLRQMFYDSAIARNSTLHDKDVLSNIIRRHLRFERWTNNSAMYSRKITRKSIQLSEALYTGNVYFSSSASSGRLRSLHVDETRYPLQLCLSRISPPCRLRSHTEMHARVFTYLRVSSLQINDAT